MMMLLVFLSLQTTQPTIDVNSQMVADRCRAASVREDEVVVCGRRDRQNPYRVGPQKETTPAIPNAEFRLSRNANVKMHAEQGEIGGIPTNRAMITLKIKL